MTWTEKPKTYKSFFFFSFLGRNIYAGVNQKQDSTRHKMLVRDLHLWHMQLLHYIAGATCVTNLMVNSSSPFVNFTGHIRFSICNITFCFFLSISKNLGTTFCIKQHQPWGKNKLKRNLYTPDQILQLHKHITFN